MNHIGLVALKAQIMRFIVQSILLQEYRRWDICDQKLESGKAWNETHPIFFFVSILARA